MYTTRRSTIRGRDLTVGGAVLVIIVTLLVTLSLGGWALMIALGMLAGYAGIPGLAIGFWPSVGLSFLLRMALSNASNSSKDS
jgi:hypothetical protein